MSTQLAQIDTKPIENKLAILRERADAIQVIDQQSYSLACQIALDGRGEVKAIGFVLDPGIDSAKRHLETLRNQKNNFVNQVTPIIELAAQKAERWKGEERRKAATEEARINEERRIEAARIAEEERKAAWVKAESDRKQREKEIEAARKAGDIGKREAAKLEKQAEEESARAKQQAHRDAEVAAANVQTVIVKPSVPTVAGIKARLNFKFEVINPNLVNRQFLKPDEVAIGAKVRADKNLEKSQKEIGGIRVWAEEGI